MLRRIFYSNRIVLWAIVLNTLLIFVGGFWPGNEYFDVLDAAFTLFFLSEAIYKISREGWSHYWSDGWNRFDFIVIVLALPSLVNPFVDHNVPNNLLLALRSFRLFKSFKMLKFVPNVKDLLKGFKMAFKASFIVVLAFIILLVVFSILTSLLFGPLAPEYFGNPGISMYSIFRLFTVEGWYEMPDAIAANSNALAGTLARIYFSLLLFGGGIIGMSLINSVFVDAMTADNNDVLVEKLNAIEKKINKLMTQEENGEQKEGVD